ncbi:MAG TPA: NYN domain-containing protein [Terriglobia bacterium]|nr:NYN domain-containing protein [Terriglobia bacterium]
MHNDEKRIAVFIDFENVAMGVRESKYGNFNIELVLKRLVEKGKIMVKRAYSDWHRYTEFKRAFHQAAIELIDVPQTRYSGKNSADIRMVVDALDLSYQKEHIDTFVLVSGDSDFSPLVSKLRENGRYVIGMGVRQSSSDLLVNNCDEFIFYEDLVRPATVVSAVDAQVHHLSPKKAEAIRLVLETFQALQREGKEVIYGSMIKQTLIRKLPSFNESYYGYPMFSRLLEDAAENQLLKLAKDHKSGGYIVTPPSDVAPAAPADAGTPTHTAGEAGVDGSAVVSAAGTAPAEPRDRDRFRRGRWDRSRSRRGDRYGDASQSATPSAIISDSSPVQSGVTDSGSELAAPAQNVTATPAEEDRTPADVNMTSEVAEDVVSQPQAVDPGPAVPGGALPVAEAIAAPAPRHQQRGRGPRRPPRFRQAAAAGSGNRAPGAMKNVETARAQPPLPDTSRETASTSLPENVPAKAAEGNTAATAASGNPAKARTARHSRPARSNKSGGSKKKPT